MLQVSLSILAEVVSESQAYLPSKKSNMTQTSGNVKLQIQITITRTTKKYGSLLTTALFKNSVIRIEDSPEDTLLLFA